MTVNITFRYGKSPEIGNRISYALGLAMIRIKRMEILSTVEWWWWFHRRRTCVWQTQRPSSSSSLLKSSYALVGRYFFSRSPPLEEKGLSIFPLLPLGLGLRQSAVLTGSCEFNLLGSCYYGRIQFPQSGWQAFSWQRRTHIGIYNIIKLGNFVFMRRFHSILRRILAGGNAIRVEEFGVASNV